MQLKIHNVSMPVVPLIHVTTKMIKSLQCIYNKGLVSYIKTLFKIKNNPSVKFANIRDNLVIKTCKKKNKRFSRKLLCAKLKEKRRNRRDKQKQNIVRIKETAPDQNAINLTLTELSESHKSLLQKGPSFVPTPSDINWYEV